MALDLGLELLDVGGELGLGGGLLLVGGAGHGGVALDLGLELLDVGGELGLGGGLLLVGGAGHGGVALDLGLELLDGGGELGLGGGLLLVGVAGHGGVALDLGLELLDGGGELLRTLSLISSGRVRRFSGFERLGELEPLGLEGLAECLHVSLQGRARFGGRLVGGGSFGERRLDLRGAGGGVLQLSLERVDEIIDLSFAGFGLFTGGFGASFGVCRDLGHLVLGGGERLTGFGERTLEVVDGARSDLLILVEGLAEGGGLLLHGPELRCALARLFARGLELLLEAVDACAGRGQLLLELFCLASVRVGGLFERGLGSSGALLAGREVTLELLAPVASLGERGLQMGGARLVLLAHGGEGGLEVGPGAPADLKVTLELLAATSGFFELAMERVAALLGERELCLEPLGLAASLFKLLPQLIAAVLRLGQLLAELFGAGDVLCSGRSHRLLDLGVRGPCLGQLSVKLLAALLGRLQVRLELGSLGLMLLVAGSHGRLEACAGLLGGGQLIGEGVAALVRLLGGGLERLDLGLERDTSLAGEFLLGGEGLGLLFEGRCQLVALLDGRLELREGGLGVGPGPLELLLRLIAVGPKLVVLVLEAGGLGLEGRDALVRCLEVRGGRGQRLTDLFQLLLGAGELIPEPAGLVLGRVEAVGGLPELTLERAQGLDARGQLVDHGGLTLELDLLLAGGLVDSSAPCGHIVLELGHLPGPRLLDGELRRLHGRLLGELGRDPLVGIEGLLEAPHLPCLLAQAGAEGGLRPIELANHPLHAVLHLHVYLVAFAHLAGHLFGQGGAFTAVSVLGDGKGEEGSGDG